MNEIVTLDELERIKRFERNIPKRKCVRHIVSEVCPSCFKHMDDRFCLVVGMLGCYDDSSVLKEMEKPFDLDEWLDNI